MTLDWYAYVLLAAVALGLAAGIALLVRAYYGNPARLVALGGVIAQIAMKTFLVYAQKRMPPEMEAEWRKAERAGRGDQWMRENWFRRKRKGRE